MVFQLMPGPVQFPDPSLADDDGLLAWGGDLSEARLTLAYAQGIFPWYSEGEPILWYAPHERCVIYPDKIKISKSMRQVIRKNSFTLTMDKDFEGVVYNCATKPRKDQDGTWITSEMQKAYINLYHKGTAHSVEVWKGGILSGGLYGISVNHVFCGESMFSHEANASKAALIWLCNNPAYSLIDCQFPTPHLMSMGAEMISREQYLELLRTKHDK